MVDLEKVERRVPLIILHILMIFLVGFGYFVLKMGLEDKLNFGDEYHYNNKLIWFFASITCIASANLIVKYRKFRYNALSFFVTWMSQYFGYTMGKGVTFDASRNKFEINIQTISQISLVMSIIALIIIVAFYLLYKRRSRH